MTDIMEILQTINRDNMTITRIANTIFVKQRYGNNVFKFELNDEGMVTENIYIRIVNATHGLVDEIMIPMFTVSDNNEMAEKIRTILSMYWSGETDSLHN